MPGAGFEDLDPKGLLAFDDDASLRADARRNRARVVAAALEIFAEHGTIDSMGQVAEVAGVAKGTVYRSFPNLGSLISAVAARQFADIDDFAQRAMRDHADPVAAFMALVRRVFAYNHDNGLFVEVLRKHELTEQLIEIQSQMRMSLALVMDRCRPSGVIRDDITPDDLFTLMGGISLRLNADRASAARWQRGADLLLMALGFPPELVRQEPDTSPS